MPETLTGESLNLREFLADPANVIVAHLSKHAIALDGAPLEAGDIVECDFPGYAPQRISDVDVMQDEIAAAGEGVSQPIVFVAGAIVTPQQAHALYLTVVKGPEALIIWKVFPLLPPFNFDVPGRHLTKQIRFTSLDDTATPQEW